METERTGVILADDEPTVRTGLKKLLSARADFEVVGEASNGLEAVELVGARRPGLVIIDVRMPVLDGLSAIEQIRSRSPDTITVILSGYDDFEYARRAVSLGAFDYLLKPTDPEALSGVLDRVRTRFLEETWRRDDQVSTRTRLSESISAFAERFYERLLKGEMAAEEIDEKLRFLGLADREITVLLAGIDDVYSIKSASEDSGSTSRGLREAIVQAARQGDGSPTIEVADGAWAVIYSATAARSPLAFAEDIRQAASKQTKLSLTVAVGSSVPLSRAAASYRDAKVRLDARFILGGNRVIADETVSGSARIRIPEESERRVRKALRFGDSVGFRSVLRELVESLKGAKVSSTAWHLFAFDLVNQAFTIEAELDPGGQPAGNPLEASREILSLTSVSDIHRWIEKRMVGVCERIASSTSGRSIAVRKAMAFISEHYTEDIGLNDVAQAVCLSPNYLSSLFKSETGKTFLEQLSRRRIAAAKDLLTEATLNVAEVAYRVGYDNPRHFGEVFRRLEGVTPGRYRTGHRE